MVRAYISRVEHGHTIPSIESIMRFAFALDIPVHEMFREPADDGKAAAAGNGDQFVSLVSSYVRKMNEAERHLLLNIAERLARDNPQPPTIADLPTPPAEG